MGDSLVRSSSGRTKCVQFNVCYLPPVCMFVLIVVHFKRLRVILSFPYLNIYIDIGFPPLCQTAMMLTVPLQQFYVIHSLT